MKIKNLCLLLLFAIESLQASSQTLTAEQIISKTYCKSYECFSSFVIVRGFSFLWKKTTKTMTSFVFNSDEKFEPTSNPILAVPNTAAIHFDRIFTTIGFVTSRKYEYLILSSQFFELGFEKVSSNDVEGGIAIYYASKQYPDFSLLIIDQLLEKNGQSWTAYNFALTRTQKTKK